MNQTTREFLEELKQREDVLGVILFGSWARGNNRPNSDVDLVVILTEGYKRTVEYKKDQAFEIIYTTADGVIDFWKSHKNDCFGLWEVAKIIYDKDGTIEKIRREALNIIKEGKSSVDLSQIKQFKFSMEDELVAIESLLEKDFVTANFVLQKTVISLTELFFDLRQLWTSAPKQRLKKIQELQPELYNLLQDFYLIEQPLKKKLEIARVIVSLVFDY